jgi:hypothetical protein
MPQGGYGSGSYRANLNQCREFLRQQCSPAAMRFLQSRLLPPSRCEVLRRKCCQQLKQVDSQYRQQAINDMVLSMMEQQLQQEEQQGAQAGQTMTMVEAAQMTLQLPAMCGLQQPSYGAAPFGYGTSPFGYGASPFGMAAGGMYQPGYGTSPFGMAGGGMSQPGYGTTPPSGIAAGGTMFQPSYGTTPSGMAAGDPSQSSCGMAGAQRWF